MISLRLQIFRSSWTFCSHSVRKCSCITFQRNSLFYEIPKSQKPQKSKKLEIPKSKSKCSIQRVEERTKDVLNFYVSKRVPKNDKIGNFSKIGRMEIFARNRTATQAPRSKTSAINRLYKNWNINFRGSN